MIGGLQDEAAKDGKLEQFHILKGFLTGSSEAKYSEAARELNMTEAALKSAIHRLRQRYRNLLRAEVSSTVADASEVDEELRFLLQAMSTQVAEGI